MFRQRGGLRQEVIVKTVSLVTAGSLSAVGAVVATAFNVVPSHASVDVVRTLPKPPKSRMAFNLMRDNDGNFASPLF